MSKLTVIAGAMMTEKSLYLIRRITMAQQAGSNVLVIKPSTDTREEDPVVHSRFSRGVTFPANIVSSEQGILELWSSDVDLVAIDEIQFFGRPIIHTVLNIMRFSDVVVSGFDKDFRGLPMPVMGELLALATKVIKTEGICVKCKKEEGSYSQRLKRIKNADGDVFTPVSAFDPDIAIEGANVVYELRCPKCFKPPVDLDEYIRQRDLWSDS